MSASFAGSGSGSSSLRSSSSAPRPISAAADFSNIPPENDSSSGFCSSAGSAFGAAVLLGSSSGSSSSPKISPNASSMLCGLSSTASSPNTFFAESSGAAGSSSRLVGRSIWAKGEAGFDSVVSPNESMSSSSPNRSANAEPTSLPEISSASGMSWSSVISVAASPSADSSDCWRVSIEDSSARESSLPSELRAANGSSSSEAENGDALAFGCSGSSAVSVAGDSISMSSDLENRESSSFAAGSSPAVASAEASTAGSADSAAPSIVNSPMSGIANSLSAAASPAATAPATAAAPTAASGTASYSSFQNVSSGSIS